MAKAAFNKKKTLHQQIGLKFKEETSKILHLVLKPGHFIKYIRYTWKVYVVLEKDDYQLNLLCEIRSIRVNAERNMLHTIKRWEAKLIGYILCRICLLKHVIEEKTEGRIGVMGR